MQHRAVRSKFLINLLWYLVHSGEVDFSQVFGSGAVLVGLVVSIVLPCWFCFLLGGVRGVAAILQVHRVHWAWDRTNVVMRLRLVALPFVAVPHS